MFIIYCGLINFSSIISGQELYMSIIPALGRLKQEDHHEFKAGMHCIIVSYKCKPELYRRPCIKKKMQAIIKQYFFV